MRNYKYQEQTMSSSVVSTISEGSMVVSEAQAREQEEEEVWCYTGGGPRTYLSWGASDKFRLLIESQQEGSRRQATQNSATMATWNGIDAFMTRQNHEPAPSSSGSLSGSPAPQQRLLAAEEAPARPQLPLQQNNKRTIIDAYTQSHTILVCEIKFMVNAIESFTQLRQQNTFFTRMN